MIEKIRSLGATIQGNCRLPYYLPFPVQIREKRPWSIGSCTFESTAKELKFQKQTQYLILSEIGAPKRKKPLEESDQR